MQNTPHSLDAMEKSYQLLSPDAVRARWPVIRTHLNRAVAHGRGELTVDDILQRVMEDQMGIMALLADGEIVAATAFEVLRYPRRKVLNFAFTGGKDGASIAANFAQVEEVARFLGADAVICMCRPAVARFIKRLMPDAEQAYVVVEKKVAQ